ncbi:ATP-binding protein [Crossiella sp. NPDC003009]
MNADPGWQLANDRYLGASLAWLRLTLRHHIELRRGAPPPPPPPAPRPQQPPVPVRKARWFTADPEPENPASPTPPPPTLPNPLAALSRELDVVARVRAEAAAGPHQPALLTLAELFGLSAFERDTLLLCAAAELDPSIANLCALAHGNERMGFPSFGLALSVLPDPAWDVVAPHRGLRRWRFLEIAQLPGQPLVTSALRTDERVVSYLKGLNHLDDRLDPLLSIVDEGGRVRLPPSQRAAQQEITAEWASGGGAVVQLAGADEPSKLLIARHAAAELGLVLYRLPAALLPDQPKQLDELARLWQRESALLPLALYLDVGEDPGGADSPAVSPVGRFVSRLGGPVLLGTRESRPELGRRSVVVDIAPPTATERVAAWRQTLGPDQPEQLITGLAAQFALDTAAISELGALAPGGERALWRGCLARTRPRMDALAQRLEPRVGWADIVLPPEELTLLHRIAEQVAHRGRVHEDWGFGERITRGLGVTALFSGPSGTGKTMAAEVLARELGLDLYRIDLSAVVSKYIGETEKNLRRLFDAAETGGAILFFDEADALFGKRSEVKDSHDRYANIEINYLLQRMESYSGLAVLATNLRNALDNAFLRRLRFIVGFPFPGAEQRKAIWRKAFPAQAPIADLDFDRLATLQVSGGMARNIALNAAFLAASGDGMITMPVVLAAARTEFRKLDLPVRDSDFSVVNGNG